MATVLGRTWSLPPYTRAKHTLLKHYLDAWLPIITSRYSPVVYIDGFAGPGGYLGGEPGSPLIALRAAIERERPLRAEAQVTMLFIERNRERFADLTRAVEQLALPPTVECLRRCARFDATMVETLDLLDACGRRLAPTFAFIDPFGYSQTPLTIVGRLLRTPHCEVLVNFMYEAVNRFMRLPSQCAKVDGLFGCTDWRALVDIPEAYERSRQARVLYEHQLRRAGARFVRSFEIWTGRSQPKYFLVFGTNNLLGLQKMKEAMWRLDPSGGRCFASPAPGQPWLLKLEPNLALLRRLILDRFSGRRVTADEVERFVLEETDFLPTHAKQVLAAMERQAPSGFEVVAAKVGRRRGTFPSGTEVQFAVCRARTA